MADVPFKPSSRVTEFLQRHTASARLAFIIDATASREPTWDMAAKLQGEMFEQVAKLGGLEIQLIYYRGSNECSRSPWLSDGQSMARAMSKVMCGAGMTQIKRALGYVRQESQTQKIAAVVFIGDAMEENHNELCDAAAGLGVPLFLFQEGDDEYVAKTFSEMARLTKGARCRFDAGAARQLGELLRAVAAFASGGVKALENLKTDGARLLLGQMK
jgi:hypothetical protein